MEDFLFISELFPDSKVVSFNLFFHGHSELLKNELHHSNLKALFAEILKEERISKFSLIAYSLGGKFALNMMNYFPEKVEQAILFAPEGIKSNNFYNFSSRVWIARKLYKSTIKNPKWFFTLAKMLKRLKIMSPSLIKFMELQMSEPNQRRMAYNTWAKFRLIFPNFGQLKQNMNAEDIDLHLLIGEKDRIIKADSGKEFINKLGKGEFRKIKTTHDIFREDYFKIIKKELKEIVR